MIDQNFFLVNQKFPETDQKFPETGQFFFGRPKKKEKKTGQLVDQETDQNHMDGTFIYCTIGQFWAILGYFGLFLAVFNKFLEVNNAALTLFWAFIVQEIFIYHKG